MRRWECSPEGLLRFGASRACLVVEPCGGNWYDASVGVEVGKYQAASAKGPLPIA